MSTATITYTDGSFETTPLVSGGGEALYVDFDTVGRKPDNWGYAWTPEPVFLESLDVVAPGRTFLLGSVCDVPPPFLPDQPWQVIRPDQYKYRNWRNGHVSDPVYDRSGHPLDGGCPGLPFRFVPADDPWEKRLLAKRTPAQFNRAAHILNLDAERLDTWPWLKKILGLFTLDATSLDMKAPPGSRNVGWLLVPENFKSRWTGHPVPENGIRHWYGFGTKQAGVSLNNEHYGLDAAWMANAIRESGTDPNQAIIDLTVGLYLLRWKIAFGLIDCPGNPFHGLWRNESGDTMRGTSGMRPSPAKEYDLGLCIAHALLPEDPLIAKGYQIRLNHWLTSGVPWNGAGGIRNLGRALQNLMVFYRSETDDGTRTALKDKARQFIEHAVTVNGIRPYFLDNMTNPNSASAGEGLSALAYCSRWCDEGVRPDYQDQWTIMGAWYEANAGTWVDTERYRAAYFIDPASVGKTWSGHFQGVNWLAAPDWCISPNVKDGLMRYMFTVYANTVDCDAAFGGEGPGWQKWLGFLTLDGARVF